RGSSGKRGKADPHFRPPCTPKNSYSARPQLKTIALILMASTLSAANKTEEFKGSMDQVWTACVRAASEKFSLKYTDKESRVLTFASGMGMRSWGMDASVRLRETDEGKIEVSVTPQKTKEVWSMGAGGSVAKKYFKP